MATTLARWRDMFAPFETAVGWFTFVAPEIPIERLVEDGHYLVRAQIPGVATKDIDISVENGVMRIAAERSEEKKENARSEFHYGKLLRRVPLPVAANEDTATAKYANGVLEISFTLSEAKGAARHVAIEVDKKTVKQSVKQTVRGTGTKATRSAQAGRGQAGDHRPLRRPVGCRCRLVEA